MQYRVHALYRHTALYGNIRAAARELKLQLRQVASARASDVRIQLNFASIYVYKDRLYGVCIYMYNTCILYCIGYLVA